MTDETRQMYADGERRLRERRIAIQPDPMVAVLNLVTADRDRLAREVQRLTALVAFVEAALPKPISTETEELRRLKGGDANGHSDSGVPVDPSGCCCGRRGSVLSQEGRVPTDPMNSPLNPEVNPPPYAALR